MTAQNSAEYSAESAAALLQLVGVVVENTRAANVAASLNTQVGSANAAFAKLSFETEPATYLSVCAAEAP